MLSVKSFNGILCCSWKQKKELTPERIIHSFTCAGLRIFTLDDFSDKVIAVASKNSFHEGLILDINCYRSLNTHTCT